MGEDNEEEMYSKLAIDDKMFKIKKRNNITNSENGIFNNTSIDENSNNDYENNNQNNSPHKEIKLILFDNEIQENCLFQDDLENIELNEIKK